MTNYVWIQDRAKQAVVRWQPWGHLVELLRLYSEYHQILLFKSRQIGASWTVAGIASWLITFFESSKVLMISQGEEEAWDLLDKARFILYHHPKWLYMKPDPDQRGMIGLPATGGVIKALPSTKNAGRSTDATLVIADEWEYHPEAEINFAAIKPTVDAGGKFVAVSTVKKLDGNTFPKRIWRAAEDKENNFKNIFFGWNVVPTRTQEWLDFVTRDLEEWQKEQEYPATIIEALSAPKTTCRFDRDALLSMEAECRSPIREEWNGWVKIYAEPIPGREYCFGIDPSEGTYDPSAGVIMDYRTLVEVAEYHGKIPIDEQARISFELWKRYNQPYIAPERNASGLLLIEKLKDMGITNFYQTNKNKIGWWTSHISRPEMLTDLAEAVRLRQIVIPNKEAIGEFYTFARTDKNLDGQAIGGAHDDYVIAWAILCQIRKTMPRRGIGFKSWVRKGRTY